jgi:hypothetical protein
MSDQEELRFPKAQQSRIAVAAATLLGAIFSAGRAVDDDLRPAEKVAGTLLVALVSISGSWFLWSLQKQVQQTELNIDCTDTEAQA